MLEAAFITPLDAAVCFGGVFIPAHHTAKPGSCLERNPTPQPQHLTKREEGTLVAHPWRPFPACPGPFVAWNVPVEKIEPARGNAREPGSRAGQRPVVAIRCAG